jgi:hypothetical protein
MPASSQTAPNTLTGRTGRRTEIYERTEPIEFTAENLRAVGEHMRAFWLEMQENMLEREDALVQGELALLARGHQLQLGHPGTAKSTLARMILGRIVDENGAADMGDIQLHIESRKGDVMGPTLPQTDPQSGRTTMKTYFDKGVIGRRHVLLDEIFDAPPAVLRGQLLTFLVERELIGRKDADALQDLDVAIAASNKTIDQLTDRYGDELDALFDRFAFIYWTTKEPMKPQTDARIMAARSERMIAKRTKGLKMGLQVAPITNHELAVVRRAVADVHHKMHHSGWAIPLAARFYREYQHAIDDAQAGGDFGELGPSKMASSRTMNVMLELLPAIAVRRHLRQPDTPLAVIHEDFQELKYWLMMRGPKVDDIRDPDAVRNEQDRAVLKRLKVEDGIFQRVYARVVEPEKARYQSSANFSAPDIQRSLRNARRYTTESTPDINEIKTQVLPNVERTINTLATVHVAEAENLYAEAVITYLKLLSKMVEGGSVRHGTQAYRRIRQHVRRLEESFHKDHVQAAEAKFKQSVTELYQSLPANSRYSGKLSKLLTVVDRIKGEEDILGEVVIGELSNLFRSAALDAIVSGKLSIATVEKACADFQDMVRAKEILVEFGIDGQLPVKRLIEVNTRALTYVRDALRKANDRAQRLAPAERADMLTLVDQTLTHYASLEPNGMGAVPSEQLPEDVVTQYVEDEANRRDQAAAGVTVKGRVTHVNGDQVVGVEWRSISEVEQEFNQTEMVTDYQAHCLDTLMADEAQLLQVPQVASLYRRKDLLAEIGYGKETLESEPELRALLDMDFMQALRTAYESQLDGQFEWPLSMNGRQLQPITIKYQSIAAGIMKKVAVVSGNNDNIRSFLEAKGINPTAANVATFGDFLRTKTPQGAQKLNIETVTIEAEEVAVGDVLDHAVANMQQAWDALRTEIETAQSELEQTVANCLVKEQLGQLSQGGVQNARQFVAKYTAFFGSATGLSGGTAYDNLRVDMTGSQEVVDAFEADVNNFLGTQRVANAGASLRDNLAQLDEVRTFLVATTAVDTTDAKRRLQECGQNLIRDWVSAFARKEEGKGAIMKQKMTGLSDIATLVSQVGSDSAEIMQAATHIQDDVIPVLRYYTEQYGIDDTTRGALIETLCVSVEKKIKDLTDGVVARVHATSITTTKGEFRMSDLNTITADNFTEVSGALRSHGVFNNALSALNMIKELAEAQRDKGVISNAAYTHSQDKNDEMLTLRTRVAASIGQAQTASLTANI